jgi:multidrug efflux pump subunit AcrA (membrane-fusion protein)
MSVCKPLSVERLLLGAALLALVGCRQESAPPAPGPLPVAIMTVAPADLAQQAVAPAQVEGVREVEVRARVTGILQTVDYAEGAKVKAGDLLFRIDPAPYAAAHALARAQLAQETARAEQATAEAARQAALFKQKAASRKEADDAQSQAAAAVGAREAAAARAELAKLDLDYCEVRSPIAGVAGRRLRTEGTLVNPIGPDGLLTTVVRADEVWARRISVGSSPPAPRARRAPTSRSCGRTVRRIPRAARSTSPPRRSTPVSEPSSSARVSPMRTTLCSPASSCACASPAERLMTLISCPSRRWCRPHRAVPSSSSARATARKRGP